MLLAMKTRSDAKLFGCPDEGRPGAIRWSFVVWLLSIFTGRTVSWMRCSRGREGGGVVMKKGLVVDNVVVVGDIG